MICWVPLRYQMLIMSTLCLTVLLSNILILHFTILCMASDLQMKIHNETLFPYSLVQACKSTKWTVVNSSSPSTQPGINTTAHSKATVLPSIMKTTIPNTEPVVTDENITIASSFLPEYITDAETTVGDIVAPTKGITEAVEETIISTNLLASVGKGSEQETSLPIAEDVALTGNNTNEEEDDSDEVNKKLIDDMQKQIDSMQLSDVPTLKSSIQDEYVEPSPVITFSWNPVVRSSLFSAFAWGALIAVIPCSWLIQRFGVRIVLPAVSCISALATLLSPTAAYLGVPFLVVCRMLQGIGFSILFPVAGAVAAQWAPLDENGIFLGMMTSCVQLAPVMTMPLAGHLCASEYGWPSVFYIHAGFTLVLAVLFCLIFRNQPGNHPRIRGDELHKILQGKTLAQRHFSGSSFTFSIVGNLFKTVPIIGILIAAFGNMCGVQLLVLYLPTYLSQVLNFDLSTTGLLSAVPTLIQFAVKLVAGYASDVGTCCSQISRLRIYNSIAMIGMALCFICVAVIPAYQADTAFSFLTLSAALLGCHVGGFFKCTMLVSRQYSASTMGLIQLITCIVVVGLPYVVTVVAPHNEYFEFRIIFFVIAGVLVLCNFVFCILCSSEPASWTNEEKPVNMLNGKEPEEASLLEGIIEMNVIKPQKA